MANARRRDRASLFPWLWMRRGAAATEFIETEHEVVIEAPIERVYATATDVSLVRRYAEEIVRIDSLSPPGEARPLVRVVIRLLGWKRAYLYRYYYDPPRAYGGLDVSGHWLRGYFHFDFEDLGGMTRVRHVEGVRSGIPMLARIVGRVYFELLNRRGIARELERLRELALGNMHRSGV